ncbi:MAG TPA: DinB family protein [Dehalococcoidia bacterium]|nr:DinB family protein [Dehalococcoidia bacterium]
MDLRDYITAHHGGIRTIFQMNVQPGLTPEELTARPSAHTNSIAWLTWHCARTEDVAINTVLRGAEQVAATHGWNARLGVEATDIGTSMGDDEVATFAESIDPLTVIEYWQAVQKNTHKWLKDADLGILDDSLDVKARLASAPAALRPGAGWVEALWSGQPGAFFVSWVAIGHQYVHLGEMLATRTALGYKGL